MKISMCENDGSYAFHMTAETMAAAALLTRYATNVTNDVRSASATASAAGTFMGYCVLGKRKTPREGGTTNCHVCGAEIPQSVLCASCWHKRAFHSANSYIKRAR